MNRSLRSWTRWIFGALGGVLVCGAAGASGLHVLFVRRVHAEATVADLRVSEAAGEKTFCPVFSIPQPAGPPLEVRGRSCDRGHATWQVGDRVRVVYDPSNTRFVAPEGPPDPFWFQMSGLVAAGALCAAIAGWPSIKRS